jgi:hypothetical protein
MVAIYLNGRITESGKLEIELPEGLPPGEVEVVIQLPSSETKASPLERPWTEEEIRDMMRIEPKTGAEIVAELDAGLIGEGWSHITMSGAEWVEEQRRKRRERNRW